jgi:hypothetical protein
VDVVVVTEEDIATFWEKPGTILRSPKDSIFLTPTDPTESQAWL